MIKRKVYSLEIGLHTLISQWPFQTQANLFASFSQPVQEEQRFLVAILNVKKVWIQLVCVIVFHFFKKGIGVQSSHWSVKESNGRRYIFVNVKANILYYFTLASTGKRLRIFNQRSITQILESSLGSWKVPSTRRRYIKLFFYVVVLSNNFYSLNVHCI